MARTALISGGSRGIGAAAVRAFSRAGYRVCFLYLHSEDQALALARETGAQAIACDVADRSRAFEACAQALRQLSHLDVLINNAGIAQSKLFTDITQEDWERMISVNLSGPFYLTQAALPGMISRKSGCILNVSSMWGQVGASMETHYSAAKAGLIGLTRALAKEAGPSGVRVNCVAPGVIDTAMLKDYDPAEKQALADETPLGRLGTPEDVASCLLFLASEDASFLTGQVIAPNGGFVIG